MNDNMGGTTEDPKLLQQIMYTWLKKLKFLIGMINVENEREWEMQLNIINNQYTLTTQSKLFTFEI